jgi:hypothetical protein
MGINQKSASPEVIDEEDEEIDIMDDHLKDSSAAVF